MKKKIITTLGRKNKLLHATRFMLRDGGFTFIELVVSVSIFALISGLLLADYGKFSSRAILNNLAHEIAQSIREAQVYGIAVREFGVASGSFPTHGINFNSTSPQTFLLFADENESGSYTAEELLEIFSLRGDNTITELCGFVSASSSCRELTELNILFTRPDPDALLLGVPGPGPYVYVRIEISPRKGDPVYVSVWTTGQISVE